MSDTALTPPAPTHEPRGATTPRTRLDWLEVGRGLAAFGVVLTHFTPWRERAPYPELMILRDLGGYAVEFFFVLSGFIILYVHGRDLGRPAALPHYAWRRAVRILPTYWLILLLSMIVNQTVQIAWARVALTPGYLAHQVFLLPGALMIGQAWTLRHELLFYAVFALVIARPRAGLAVFAAWMLAAAVNLILHGSPNGIVDDGVGIVLHHYNIDFPLGMLVAVAAWRDRLGLAVVLGLAAAAAFQVCLLLDPTVDAWRLAALKPLFAAIVAAAVWASRRGLAAPKPLILLGGMSYALYISHELFGTAVGGVLRRAHLAPWPLLVTGLRAGAALVGAYLVYRLFERPLLKRLNATRPSRGSSEAEGVATPSDETGVADPAAGTHGSTTFVGPDRGGESPDRSGDPEPPVPYSSSSNDTALAPVADSRTWSPSTSATRPSEI